MLRIVISLLIALAFGQTTSNPTDGEAVGSPKFFLAGHIPTNIKGSLKLTTGDLKLFSGHALHLLRTKCPNVDPQKIFQIQKYIGKKVSKTLTLPQLGQSEVFHSLLLAMTSCSVQPEARLSEKTSPQGLLFLYHKALSKAVVSSTDNALNPDIKITLSSEEMEIKKPILGPIQEEAERKEVKTFKWTSMNPVEKEKAIDYIFEDGDDSVLPNSEQIETEDAKGQGRVISTTYIVQPLQKQSGGLYSWISTMWSSISNFFGRVFGMEGGRYRRSLPADDRPAVVTWNPEADSSNGKKAFEQLMEELCDIYCNKCTGRKEIPAFKSAARELLTFLFEDESGIDLAATHYLDPTFLQNVSACAMD